MRIGADHHHRQPAPRGALLELRRPLGSRRQPATHHQADLATAPTARHPPTTDTDPASPTHPLPPEPPEPPPEPPPSTTTWRSRGDRSSRARNGCLPSTWTSTSSAPPATASLSPRITNRSPTSSQSCASASM